jgi:hypothetical protein
MGELIFQVQGSSEEPYRVQFVKKSETQLSAFCNCQAGENGQYCKHRFQILDGITKGIVSENLDQVPIVQNWLKGTLLEEALQRVGEIEFEVSKLKKVLSNSKKDVAKIMHS